MTSTCRYSRFNIVCPMSNRCRLQACSQIESGLQDAEHHAVRAGVTCRPLDPPSKSPLSSGLMPLLEGISDVVQLRPEVFLLADQPQLDESFEGEVNVRACDVSDGPLYRAHVGTFLTRLDYKL
jgi:hypothetical protein